jgi:hypothetical protein
VAAEKSTPSEPRHPAVPEKKHCQKPTNGRMLGAAGRPRWKFHLQTLSCKKVANKIKRRLST